MPKKKLEPIIYNDAWHKKLAEYLFNNIQFLVFDPLIEASNIRMDNSKITILEKALKEGVITYSEGSFKGKFWAQISKEIKSLGAVFKRGEWLLHDSKLPFIARSAIEKNRADIKILTININEKLDKITQNIPSFITGMTKDTMGLRGIADDNLNHLSRKLKATVKKAVGIQPKLDPEGLKKISRDYLTTIDLPIRKTLERDYETGVRISFENFAQDIVEKLRIDLNKMIIDGAPRKEVQKFIGSKLKLSKDRSIFIARQETALLTTKFKKSQYEQYGMYQYEWQTMGDHKVRSRHAELDGQTIDWSNPPIVDKKTGRTAHAGEDFRCFVGETPISSLGIPIRSYNRHYVGKIITLDTGIIRIKTTPNHPILTDRGWVPAQFIDKSYKLFHRLSSDITDISTQEINNRLVTIEEIHDFFTICFPTVRVDGSNVQFHGDGTNEEINVISLDSSLLDKGNVIFPENISQNILTNSYPASCFFHSLSNCNGLFDWYHPTDSSSMTGFDLVDSSSGIHPAPLKFFRGTMISNENGIFFKNTFNGIPSTIKLLGNDIDAISRFVHFDDIINRQIFFVPSYFMPFTLASFNTISHDDYSGYVYNLETESNLYVAGDIIVSNCRCQAVPIVEW